MSYYKRFIQGFAEIARPLYYLLRKDTEYHWGPRQDQAFKKLKEVLTSEPILIRPNWTKSFHLYTDASALGLGAVLTQRDDKNKERVIYYYSKVTTKVESTYGSMELECLAVKEAVKAFQIYLLGRYFEIIIDNQALKWLFNLKDPKGLFTRWIAALMEYDATVIYRKESLNRNADSLSRIPKPQGTQGRVCK